MTIVGNFGVVLLGASCEQVASKLRASRERIEARGCSSQKARCIALHWAMWCNYREIRLPLLCNDALTDAAGQPSLASERGSTGPSCAPMTTITLNLPDALAERAGDVARVVHRPVEEVLTAMLDGVLPAFNDVPGDMRSELVEMTWWDDGKLMEAADAMLSAEEQARMAEFSRRDVLTKTERIALDQLRTAYAQITLRKARAAALLSIRSGKGLLAEVGAP